MIPNSKEEKKGEEIHPVGLAADFEERGQGYLTEQNFQENGSQQKGTNLLAELAILRMERNKQKT